MGASAGGPTTWLAARHLAALLTCSAMAAHLYECGCQHACMPTSGLRLLTCCSGMALDMLHVRHYAMRCCKRMAAAVMMKSQLLMHLPEFNCGSPCCHVC